LLLPFPPEPPFLPLLRILGSSAAASAEAKVPSTLGESCALRAPPRGVFTLGEKRMP